MKKFIFSFVIMLFSMMAVNAQIATENQKFFDNVYVGVEGGVFSPMDFNSMFPLNSVAGLKLGKQITPVFGVEVEGTTFFNENNLYRWTNTFVKGTNVGLNGTMNLTNLFKGYKGTPRKFEVKTNTGLGWIHYWNAGNFNGLTGKTALDFDFNLGKAKAHTISFTPGVFWNLMPVQYSKLKFDKRFAQVGVMVGYTYHFKTSNGTHAFKTYDIGAMKAEINRLNAELAQKPTEVIKDHYVEKVVEKQVGEVVVFFAKGSTELTPQAKQTLNKIQGTVDIYGFASPEGSADFNKRLSERRAQVVADYLVNLPQNIKIHAVSGEGTVDNTTGRVTVIKVAE